MTEEQCEYALWIIEEYVSEADSYQAEDDWNGPHAETCSLKCARHLLHLIKAAN